MASGEAPVRPFRHPESSSVHSLHRARVPGQLQTLREQPDPAAQARGEAGAASGPDLAEAEGGGVEVGGGA